MLIEIDIPQESVAGFRALCTFWRIEIQREVPNGPAGGNPCFFIAVHSRDALEALGEYYFGK